MIIHTATLCPAIFDHGDLVAFIFDNGIGMIFAFGLILMDILSHKSSHALDLWLAQHPARVLDGMAAHIQHYTAAGTVHVPEPGHVRTWMFFGLFGKERFADRAFVDQNLSTDILGSKQEFL